MDKENVVHVTMSYYSDTTKNEIESTVATWMKLEDVLLGK
jgi:hypothetical protein